jgi:hypothetical protein
VEAVWRGFLAFAMLDCFGGVGAGKRGVYMAESRIGFVHLTKTWAKGNARARARGEGKGGGGGEGDECNVENLSMKKK